MDTIRVEVGGAGAIRYRCATCGELIDGEATLVADLTYHSEHLPEDDDGA